MSGLVFRDLRADEIECRVGSIKSAKGCTLLLYKNARTDMDLLDETVGTMNWKRTHEEIKGNLFCNVSIKQDGEWITKQDVGVESNQSKEKGEASDAFKRAGTNWGIGRELYTSPFIWINLNNGEAEEYKGKWKLSSRTKLSVGRITIENKTITSLTIIDQNKKQRFSYVKSNVDGNLPITKASPSSRGIYPPKQKPMNFDGDPKTRLVNPTKNQWLEFNIFKSAFNLTDKQLDTLAMREVGYNVSDLDTDNMEILLSFLREQSTEQTKAQAKATAQ